MTTDGPPVRVLTFEEVLDLPDGTLVEVAWGGSTGPLHRYTIRQVTGEWKFRRTAGDEGTKRKTWPHAANPDAEGDGPEIRQGDLVTLAPLPDD